MDEQHTHDLLAAYVLSAVTPDEAALVQQHLAGCASCQRLERELRAVASVLPELAGDLTPQQTLALGREVAQILGAAYEERRLSPPRWVKELAKRFRSARRVSDVA